VSERRQAFKILDLRGGGEPPGPRVQAIDPEVSDAVGAIVDRVRLHGNEALHELTEQFDGCDLRVTGLEAKAEEFEAARAQVPSDLKRAIDAMIDRLDRLHRRQRPEPWTEPEDGFYYRQVVRPLSRVGCYVPGGRAAYPSTVAMTVVPARVAGVDQIVVCSPPSADGSLPPSVLYAAERAGAHRVLKVGGAQAVAALAFGTHTVPAVSKVVGPGNVYVTEAKRQLAGVVGIDGLKGPSELVVVAEGSADPELTAADLLAQAEHEPLAATTLVTTDPDLVRRTESAFLGQLAGERAAGRMESFTPVRAVLVRDLDAAVAVVDALAPEHLQVLLPDASAFADIVRNAGAIFLGPWTAVPFGDYGVGSNHVLPTMGTARFSSGLSTGDFVTVSAVLELGAEAAARLAPEVAAIARSEGLPGHARAVELRALRAQTPEPVR
jgi:histidinol dehydrogenase